jgi:hypothetical protein
MGLPHEITRSLDLLVGWQRYFLAVTTSPDHIIALRYIRNALLEIRRQVEIHKLERPLNRRAEHNKLLLKLEEQVHSFNLFENASQTDPSRHRKAAPCWLKRSLVSEIVNCDQVVFPRGWPRGVVLWNAARDISLPPLLARLARKTNTG